MFPKGCPEGALRLRAKGRQRQPDAPFHTIHGRQGPLDGDGIGLEEKRLMEGR